MAHGGWYPVADLPPELKDGRYVLLWTHGRPLVAFWAEYGDGGDWSTDDGNRPVPTLYAELAHPIDRSPTYDVWQDK